MKGPPGSQSQQQLHHHHLQQQHQQQQYQQQQQQQMMGQEDSHSNEDSKSPINQCSSPLSKDGSRKMKKYDSDDLSQDKVSRIYQEELAKLMSRAPREASFPK